MSLGASLLAAAVGYLLGSVSFARVIVRLFAPERDITVTDAPVDGASQPLRMNAVSATSVRIQMGNRFGCLTSLLDMVKVTVPTLLFRLLWPESDAYLIAAACGVLGHNWPLWYRFRGGYGQSPTFGGLLVVDWTGVVVVFVATLLVFVVTRHIYAALLAGFLTLIPWFYLRAADDTLLWYALVVNVAYAVRLLPDLRQYLAIRRRDKDAATPR